jgi:hypothetical protein
MQLVKEGAKWLISGMQGNEIFGSTLVADKPDLRITNSDVSCSVVGIIGITVHNIGNADAENVDVQFNETVSGTSCSKNVPRITAHSYANVVGDCLAGCTPGTSFTIKVDPDRLIDELEENNNIATKSF